MASDEKCHECGVLQEKENGLFIDGFRFNWFDYDVWFCTLAHKEIWLERNNGKIQKPN